MFLTPINYRFSYGLGKDLKINFGKGAKPNEQARKEGEIKKNQNFDKLAGIFGDNQKEQEKGGKVFEYHQREEDNQEEEDVEYSHEHLEEFMKSLNEHNKNKGFKQTGFTHDDHDPKEIGNSTLNPEQTDNLISNFLQNVNHNSNQDPQTVGKYRIEIPSKRAGSEIMSANVERMACNQTGATLSNSLAYSQSNASVLGTNQFNSVSLVSGVKLRQKEALEEEKFDNQKLELDERQKRHSTQELNLNDDDDEDLDRDDN